EGRGPAAGGGRPRPALDVLLVGVARIPEVGVGVDESRDDRVAPDVEDLGAGRRLGGAEERDDPPVADGHPAVEPAAVGEDPAGAQHEVMGLSRHAAPRHCPMTLVARSTTSFGIVSRAAAAAWTFTVRSKTRGRIGTTVAGFAPRSTGATSSFAHRTPCS